MIIKIKEALTYYNSKRAKGAPEMKQADLGKVIFGEDQKRSWNTKMVNLVSGKTERVHPDWVIKICKTTGVEPNFLFGWTTTK